MSGSITMKPFLFDEGLPAQVAVALDALGWTARAVLQPGAPAEGASDEENCKWCKSNGDAILITNDFGKKDKAIHIALARNHTHAIFVPNALRDGPAHKLAVAVLLAEHLVAQYSAKGLLHHQLRSTGNLVKC